MSSDRALVMLTTELRGYLAPCGCTSDPLGGIARFAALVEAKRQQQRDALVVTAGNFLFDSADESGPSLEQDEKKAELVASIYRELGVTAQGLGSFDVAHKGGAFAAAQKNPWLRSGAWRVHETAGLRVAFFGLGPEDVDPAKAEKERPEADVCIALSAFDWAKSREVARSLAFIDVIVAGGGLHAPATIGKTLVVDAGEQGERVGLLEIVKGPGERWSYFDAGANELAQTKRQLQSLEREIAALDKAADPASRVMRVERREALARRVRELEDAPPPPPPEKHLRFTTVALSKRMSEHEQVAKRVRAYNQTLCELSARATAELPCPEAPQGSAVYVGSEACGACHSSALQQWKTTKHAHAVKTLEDAGKFCDLGCIGCHTVGFNAPGGFCSPQKVGPYKEVGCEMCHGPGSLHIQKGGAKVGVGPKFQRDPGEQVCLGCHTKEHSDLFDFAKYRPRILGPGHGIKETR